MPQHVAVGSGQFALGFACDVARQAGFTSVVLQRPTNSARTGARLARLLQHGRFGLQYIDAEQVSIDAPVCVTGFDRPDAATLDIFSAPDLELISVALPPQAIRDAAGLIANATQARLAKLGSAAPMPAILTCMNLENNGLVLFNSTLSAAANQFGRDSEIFKYLSNSQASFPVCVVDRVCTFPDSSDDSRDAPPSVIAESFGRLVFQLPTDCTQHPTLRALTQRVPQIVSQTESIQAWSEAKYWGVNGLHLVLAATIGSHHHDDGWRTTTFAEHLASNHDLVTLARNYLREVSAALRLRHPSSDHQALDTYVHATLSRFQSVPDTPARILRDLRLPGLSWRPNLEALVSAIADGLAAQRTGERDSSTPARLPPDAVVRIAERHLNEIFRVALLDFLGKIHMRILPPVQELSWGNGLYPIGGFAACAHVLDLIARDANHV